MKRTVNNYIEDCLHSVSWLLFYLFQRKIKRRAFFRRAFRPYSFHRAAWWSYLPLQADAEPGIRIRLWNRLKRVEKFTGKFQIEPRSVVTDKINIFIINAVDSEFYSCGTDAWRWISRHYLTGSQGTILSISGSPLAETFSAMTNSHNAFRLRLPKFHEQLRWLRYRGSQPFLWFTLESIVTLSVRHQLTASSCDWPKSLEGNSLCLLLQACLHNLPLSPCWNLLCSWAAPRRSWEIV